jgi:hypothetical protein
MADTLNYSDFIDKAMRGVVRDVLRRVLAGGLPGEHHFYISFATDFPGVRISEGLKAKYPQEITIVLQHQFWDFKVEDQQFQVTLSFGGVPEKLVIPFAALTAFADPSVKFGLQFQRLEPANSPQPTEEDDEPLAMDFSDEVADNGSAEVISLDAFRKK